ncbi:MAG: transglutaminase-like cysteine peptidase [Alphaproteobacteria bacterium]
MNTRGRHTGSCGVLKGFRNTLNRNRLGELLVIKGHISSQDLRFVLKQQQLTQQPLGFILLEHALISESQLNRILMRQWFLRMMAASMLFLASASVARADDAAIGGAPVQVSLTMTASGYNKIISYPGLFGTAEKRSGNLKPFTKWTGMFARYNRDLQDGANSAAVNAWKQNLQNFTGMSLKEMAERVNNLANEQPYISDKRNWRQSDYWETPVEFLERGGDCEDFAIAKYAGLRALGVPEDRLRIAIVHDNVKNIPHAVLAVYTDEGVYVLDQQIKSLIRAGDEGRYRPIFSINRQGWWLHSEPDRTMVASVQ